jgi:hypothetical protein
LNNTITVQDYRNALQIYGEDLGVLKGQTTQKKPEHISVSTLEKTEPKNIILIIDIIFFTGLPFLITVSRNIKFITAHLLSDRKRGTILKAILQVLRIYQGTGHAVDDVEIGELEFPVHKMLVDNEFTTLRDDIQELGIDVHKVSKNEHVTQVERQNRVIKERARGIIQTLPYKKVPKKVRIALIHYVVFWLYNLPRQNQIQSPKEMIMGQQVLDCKSVCQLPFGAYVQVHDDQQMTDNIEPRTTGGIYLGASSMQRGHKFFNLSSGEIIVRRKWTELPVPSDVILCLEELSSDPNDLVETMDNHKEEQ